MIGRNAEETDRTGWVMIILFILVVAVALFAAYRFGVVDKISVLLPSYNQTVEPASGIAIVGLNLNSLSSVDLTGVELFEDPSLSDVPEPLRRRSPPPSYHATLEYYTGSEWTEAKGSSLRVGNKELANTDAFATTLIDFYLTTVRSPSLPYLPMGPSPSTYFLIPSNYYPYPNGVLSFITEDTYGDRTEKQHSVYLNVVSGTLHDSPRSTVVSTTYDTSVAKILIGWFDSILAGRSCEKYVSLTFKENGQEVTRSYALSYNNGFLYVDLDKPALKPESFSPTCYPALKDINTLSRSPPN